MEIVRGGHRSGFTQLPNATIRDTRHSMDSLACLAYLLSHEPGWKTTRDDLAQHFGVGQHRVREALKRLTEAGYLDRVRYRADGGMFAWRCIIRDEPVSDLPASDPVEPCVENRHMVDSQQELNSQVAPCVDSPPMDEPSVDEPHADGRPISTKKTNPEEKRHVGDAAAVVAAVAAPTSSLDPPPKIDVGKEPPRLDVTRLCQRLADEIVANGNKRPTIGKHWHDPARLLLDRDRRPLDEALRIIAWCQENEFWRQNILSMSKFREKYDRLRMQMESERTSNHRRMPARSTGTRNSQASWDAGTVYR